MKDEYMKQSIRRCKEIEELLRAKDEELKVGKCVAVECGDLRVKVLSFQDKLEQNATRVGDLRVECMEKVAGLERKVA